jgi:hypothetical protein
MRGDSSTKGARSRRGGSTGRGAAPASASEPRDASETKVTAEAAEADAVDADDPPLNRAERRARGKKGQHQPGGQGHGKVAGAKGPVQSPRMWSNRRSG